MKNKIEEIAFLIISNAGDAKSLAIEAINLAKENQFEKAYENIEKAKKAVIIAEQSHFELIAKEANNEMIDFSLLLTHSEDQMMSAQTIITLAVSLIEIYEKLSS